MNTIKYGLSAWCMLCSLLLAIGCKKTDSFYQEQKNMPELYVSPEFSYKAAYAVGDTMTLYGRLNPAGDLRISIGDARARIVKTAIIPRDEPNYLSGESFSFTIDEVKVLITAAMGPGHNRPVSITLDGNTIQCPVIQIYSREQSGYLNDSLKLVNYYTPNPGPVYLHCVNGKGAVYFYANKFFQQVKKDAVATTLFGVTDLKDKDGAFAISTFFSGGVDTQEENLYFTAATTDTASNSAREFVYRFCRYNIASRQLTTLNRTLLPRDQKQVTLANYQPFEGSLANAKMAGAIEVYPDDKGGIYLQFGRYAIGYASAAGQLKYIYRSSDVNITPQIWDGANGTAAFINISEIPGLLISGVSLNGDVIDPRGNRLYLCTFGGPVGSVIYVYDLVNQIRLYNYQTALLPVNAAPQINGSFSSLSGFASSQPPFGLMPLTNSRLLLLYYLEKGGANSGPWAGMPAWGVLDFPTQEGMQYAPGSFNTGGFSLNRQLDVLLNYDEEGQLYMTANSKQVMVKTVVR